MKEIVKNYNFCNLNLDIQDNCVNKNNLSIKEFVNISLEGNTIKPTNRFDDLFKDILGDNIYQIFINKYGDLIGNFIYLTSFDYYDLEISDYKSVYFLIDNELNLYKFQFNSNDILLENTSITFNKMPIIFTNNGKIYFYSKNDIFLYFEKNDLIILITDSANLVSFCNYQDKLFFTPDNDINSVYYNDRIDIENIGNDLSFYNKFKVNSTYGKILKIINFKNNLYIIQQYAVSRVWIVSGNYYIYCNCSINAKIIASTIGEFNDYLVFYTTAGLYLFDGNEIKKIFSNITKKINPNYDNINAVVFNNKYYLLSPMLVSNCYKNALIEFDIFNLKSSINIIGNVKNIYTIQTIIDYNLVAVCENENIFSLLKLSHTFLNENSKYVKFNKITFDDNISKNITRIKTISTGDFYLKISSETTQKIIKVTGDLNISAIGISGFSFDIEIYSDSFFEIKSILFSIQTISE